MHFLNFTDFQYFSPRQRTNHRRRRWVITVDQWTKSRSAISWWCHASAGHNRERATLGYASALLSVLDWTEGLITILVLLLQVYFGMFTAIECTHNTIYLLL